MYKPYKTPIVTASPDIKVREPRVSKFVVFLVNLLGRLYLFLYFGVVRTVLHGDSLIDAFKRHLAGESRCILAFRHPNGGEPQILTMFTLFKLRRVAAKRGVRFSRRPHAVFLYGFEVTRYGGWPARYVMPNLGAMPIHHSKVDSTGMRRVYNYITEGDYPLALAPEGQVSYFTDSVPHLESGVIRMGFHAAQHLADKKNDCPVEILPVSIHFRFGILGNVLMNRLLKKIEKNCGFSGGNKGDLSFAERLRRCRDHVLKINEGRYNINSDESLPFDKRLEQVVYAALETAERMLDLKSEGDFFSRLYKVRQICWDRIFLPGVDNFDDISPVERSTLDLRAGEAWHIARHQELADFGWYFHSPVPSEDSTLHQKIEYIQNLWDFASRTMGGALSDRKNILLRKVIVYSAPVINLSERLPDYKKDKKATIAACISDLEKAYLDCIDEVNNKMEKDYE